MKTKFILSLCAALSLIACNKEPDEKPFSAVGYWKGNIDIYGVGILVRDNGTSRLYMGLRLGDTTGALQVSDGVHTVTGNSFQGKYPYITDTLLFSTYTVSAGKMEGMAYSVSGAGFGFDVRKQ